MLALETNNLCKYYGKYKGIEEVSLQVEQGSIFGFIGPNGAGKSTAIRTILNLLKRTSGESKIFGMDTTTHHAAVMQKIGYLPGDASYYPDMTAKEMLEYSASFFAKKTGNRMHELSERFQLDLSKPFSDLSLGNKQKVGIIQAVLHKPELLILDEPTNGLDPLMQNEFFQLMKEEHGRGTTLFFSSHILADVQRICQQVAIIKDGKIIANEDIHQIRKKQLKKCMVMLERMVTEKDFDIPGITALICKENQAYFSFSGDLSVLLRHFSQMNIKDMTLEEPGLEEIFIHYYQHT